jgi:hypothetical protein
LANFRGRNTVPLEYNLIAEVGADYQASSSVLPRSEQRAQLGVPTEGERGVLARPLQQLDHLLVGLPLGGLTIHLDDHYNNYSIL